MLALQAATNPNSAEASPVGWAAPGTCQGEKDGSAAEPGEALAAGEAAGCCAGLPAPAWAQQLPVRAWA